MIVVPPGFSTRIALCKVASACSGRSRACPGPPAPSQPPSRQRRAERDGLLWPLGADGHVSTLHRDAVQFNRRGSDLASQGLTSRLTLELARTRAAETSTRRAIEKQRVAIGEQAAHAQRSMFTSKLDQLRTVAVPQFALGVRIRGGHVVRVGGLAVYHAGDCQPFDGQAEILRPLGVDVALLPINGRAPERRVPGNFWGDEAVRLAHAIGARVAIPCHYEMFTFNTATPDAFVAEAGRLGQAIRVLRAGERWSSAES